MKSKKQTFYSWLMEQRERDDLIGDLAGDAQGDEAFEECGEDKQRLIQLLHSSNACEGALEALDEAFHEYRGANREPNRKGSFLVIQYIPNSGRKIVDGFVMGVHTPLRQDGVYFELDAARELADEWEEENFAEGY